MAMGATRIMPSREVLSAGTPRTEGDSSGIGVKVDMERANRRFVSRAPMLNGRQPFAAREI